MHKNSFPQLLFQVSNPVDSGVYWEVFRLSRCPCRIINFNKLNDGTCMTAQLYTISSNEDVFEIWVNRPSNYRKGLLFSEKWSCQILLTAEKHIVSLFHHFYFPLCKEKDYTYPSWNQNNCTYV